MAVGQKLLNQSMEESVHFQVSTRGLEENQLLGAPEAPEPKRASQMEMVSTRCSSSLDPLPHGVPFF